MKVIRKISISEKTLSKNYPKDIFSNFSYAYNLSTDHKEITKKLIDKNPYTITVIIDNLNSKLWRNKKYAQPIRINILPKYTELLYKYFFEEYGNHEGNEVYRKYLEKYRSAWKQDGMKRERYYNLPSPLDHVDWRNPYDNIFVWQEGDKKLIRSKKHPFSQMGQL